MFLTLIYYKNIFFFSVTSQQLSSKRSDLLSLTAYKYYRRLALPNFTRLGNNSFTHVFGVRGSRTLRPAVELRYFNQILILYPITRDQPRNGLFGIPFIVWLPHQSTTGYSSVSFQKVYCYHD